MAPEEYSTGGGGKLKLKGSKVSDGRVEKKKKKKSGKKNAETAAAETGADARDPSQRGQPGSAEPEVDSAGTPEPGPGAAAKTEAERKYEEVRRKRLQDRLQREGIKTHKERVEDLNKYLSRLSEHHDMPKIGPG
ncbi:uncharacterized protein N7459_007284 [Penicillium hispanicum]|uniref:uncharacterized protein n=1 Tax=Penicillium hispanicum TaxID=1080232 RepID=UPI00253FCEEB|nr:uncharacterized protein N7459_007284 [Penicillium hispanicum]KAJ5578320.1 hypothetical protein N7459_007284 [Penicillium hispanicum]